MSFGQRLRHAWDVLRNKDPSTDYGYIEGASYSRRPDRPTMHLGGTDSILTPIYNKLAIDVAALSFEEVKVDQNGRYKSTIRSGLTECLQVSANIDQSARMFKQECCMNLFEEGCIAIVPTKTDVDPANNGGYSIEELRVGTIQEWFPEDVRISLYNDRTGLKEEIIYPKRLTAIVENPFYAVMNETNSLIRTVMKSFDYQQKMNNIISSGKLNMIIQLPWSVHTAKKKALADSHLANIENQLETSEHGIAYIDATEKIIQLNRSVENNFTEQIKFALDTLYAQLGLTEAIMNNTAGEQEMLNYYNRTVEPIAEALASEMNRKFLTKTGRTRGHAVMYFRDPFKLVPVEKLAEIADKFTRNEILSSNEVRAIIGYRPVEDPRADELRNKNLNLQEGVDPMRTTDTSDEDEEDIQNGSI